MPRFDVPIGTNNISNAVETVVMTVPAGGIPAGATEVPQAVPATLRGVIQLSPAGTTTSALQVRVRQNSLTGAQVGPTFQAPAVGGANSQCAYDVVDNTGATQWVVTAQQVAGAAAGNVGGSCEMTIL